MMNRLKNTYYKIKNSKGVTLTELLIVIAVMGVALLPASQALFMGIETFVTENENMGRVYDGHTALEMITDKIRFNGTEVLTDIKIESITLDGEIREALKIKDEYIYHNGDQKIISSITGQQKVLLEHVESMTFDEIEYFDKDNTLVLSQFDISIVINKKEYGEQVFNTTIYLRNR